MGLLMCRIAGIIDFQNSLGQELESILISMRDSMVHGGPDDGGVFISENREVALANRRLSIIDTSPLGHQPMSNASQTIWITYNGEIYNFQELKKELTSSGYKFKSNCDTEVLIYGYEEWGIEILLSKLQGMFAFAIYDKRHSKFILARDRLGIKPVYYYYKENDKFIFASEVKAFLKSNLIENKKNQDAIYYFLQLGSIPTPLTTIKDVYILPAAHYITIENKKLVLKKYWELSSYFLRNEKSPNLKECINQTKSLFHDAFNMRLVSDVPLGVFLSGGMDSSALIAMSNQKVKTLSIIFDEASYSETEYQRLVASTFKTDHHEFLLNKSGFYNELPNLFAAMDQPSIDGINTYFISKAAKETGLKVVLSGVGGDEVFLGYHYYKQERLLNTILKTLRGSPALLRNMILHQAAHILKNKSKEKLQYFTDPSPVNLYLAIRGLFAPSEVQNILRFNPGQLAFNSHNDTKDFQSVTNYLNYMDFHHYLQNQILKDIDCMSMAHSVEVRVPFLDHKLTEYVTGISPRLKLKDGRSKYLLTQIAEKLPKEIIERKKMGFMFPFSKWLNCKEIENELGQVGKTLGIEKITKNLWDGFVNNQIHWSRIWGVIVLKHHL